MPFLMPVCDLRALGGGDFGRARNWPGHKTGWNFFRTKAFYLYLQPAPDGASPGLQKSIGFYPRVICRRRLSPGGVDFFCAGFSTPGFPV